MALRTSRIATVRGRPVVLMGIRGLMISHCSSVRSDGYGLRMGACSVGGRSCGLPTPEPVYEDSVLPDSLSLDLELHMTLPMPDQDEHLPDQIEAYVHQAALELQRRMFQVLMEKADQELVLTRRHGHGGEGIQRRGTRPFTFKT